MSLAFAQSSGDLALNKINFMEENNSSDVDEIFETIQLHKVALEEKIKRLEFFGVHNPEIEKKIAIVIRQCQYLEYLENMPKAELEELFL